MDYQPPINQSADQPTDQPMDQSYSSTTWYCIAGAAVVIAALALWYYSTLSPILDISNSASEQTQSAPLSGGGNTTTDIMIDLNQTQDGSDALNQAAAASAQSVQGF